MKIVTTVSIPQKHLDEISHSFSNIEISHCHSEEGAQMYLSEADMVISDHVSFSSKSLEKAHKLKWLQLLTAGVEKMPLKELDERKVIVTNVRGIHGVQMSEYALSVMLAHTRKLGHYAQLQKNHQWEAGFVGDELYGKTVTIVGTGAIGSEIAKKCQVFGMKVYGVNRSGAMYPHFDLIVKEDEWEETLPVSSFIIVLLPVTPSTKQFIRKEHFEQMKSDCYFINMSRGEIVNEIDLINALQQNQIGGAALDVFATEPLDKNSRLWDMDNVFITPHHSGSSNNYMERAFSIIVENIKLFQTDQKLINVINIREGY